ncbi:hypothetical protein HPB47_001425 [Ixodes persulcatus]|uniref:Uncharacterized protein n=1 Tax=Ixodes persulcatus TaxID=34615 RepID=A0AC60PPR9_IXOPE|nr:hypothetical protein HPB47_001425 [Ixodes persulcatus]
MLALGLFIAMSGQVAHNYTLIFGDIALLQLLVTLRFYCAGTFQTVTRDLVHVSHPMVCHIVRMVMMLIVSVLFRRLVHFPAASECHTVMLDLYRMGQFPGITGCIDCTHVCIRSPGGDDAEVYRN